MAYSGFHVSPLLKRPQLDNGLVLDINAPLKLELMVFFLLFLSCMDGTYSCVCVRRRDCVWNFCKVSSHAAFLPYNKKILGLSTRTQVPLLMKLVCSHTKRKFYTACGAVDTNSLIKLTGLSVCHLKLR